MSKGSGSWCSTCGMPCGYFSPVSGSLRGFCAHPRFHLLGAVSCIEVFCGERCWLVECGEQLVTEIAGPGAADGAGRG